MYCIADQDHQALADNASIVLSIMVAK